MQYPQVPELPNPPASVAQTSATSTGAKVPSHWIALAHSTASSATSTATRGGSIEPQPAMIARRACTAASAAAPTCTRPGAPPLSAVTVASRSLGRWRLACVPDAPPPPYPATAEVMDRTGRSPAINEPLEFLPAAADSSDVGRALCVIYFILFYFACV
jgi:hypothetical protein